MECECTGVVCTCTGMGVHKEGPGDGLWRTVDRDRRPPLNFFLGIGVLGLPGDGGC